MQTERGIDVLSVSFAVNLWAAAAEQICTIVLSLMSCALPSSFSFFASPSFFFLSLVWWQCTSPWFPASHTSFYQNSRLDQQAYLVWLSFPCKKNRSTRTNLFRVRCLLMAAELVTRTLEYHCVQGEPQCHCDWRLTLQNCIESRPMTIIYYINIAISALVFFIGTFTKILHPDV